MAKKKTEDLEGFLSRVDKGEACWIWKLSKNKDGYGCWNFRGKPCHAHRVAWTLFRGDIPAGLHVLHVCDVRPCCNPDHLFLGTHQDNMKDRKLKGRRNRPRRADRTHNRAKLTPEMVAAIRNSGYHYGKGPELRKQYGISSGTLSKILNWKIWNTAA